MYDIAIGGASSVPEPLGESVPGDVRMNDVSQKCTYEHPEIHQRWETIYRNNRYLDLVNEAILNRIVKILKVPTTAIVLDAGCGTADHCIRMAKRGFRCVGVDISEWVLAQAAVKVAEAGVQDKVELRCHALDKLPFENNSFDVVHCRGVLMHIPDWEAALQNMCRVLKPGGGIAIFENCASSVESLIIRVARCVTNARSSMVKTAGGVEFWSDEAGTPFVVRYARISYLVEQLGAFGISSRGRIGTRFLDIGRLPSQLREIGAKLNCAWMTLRIPAFLSGGNVVLGIKQE